MPYAFNGDAPEPAAKEPLVYGILNDNLILLPDSVAKTVRDELRAISALETWGEARRLCTTYLAVPDMYDDDEDEESSPRDSDLYNAFDTNQYQNCDWPPPAATVALDECPDELYDIGEQVEYFPSFPRRHIDPATEAEVVATARERGFVIYRDDDLISEIGLGVG
jgi:hypothetical protein